MSSKINVGVLRGGPSSEYYVSLNTGASVLKHLPEKYSPRDILISKDGLWHLDGFEKGPERILHGVDVIWNAMHGQYGEDGTVQSYLKNFGVKYTGSEVLPSAMAMNKLFAKDILAKEGIQTPAVVSIRSSDNLEDKLIEVFERIHPPFIVKPLSLGSSIGVSMASDFAKLASFVSALFPLSECVLVEEYISGKEATCGVIDHFRGREIYSLPPVEIRPSEGSEFFDFNAKYSGGSSEICPGNFSGEEKRQIEKTAALAHKLLGLRHYSRSDFIVSPEKGIYFLEVNTLPGLTEESLLPKSLEAIGCSMPDFLDHVLTLALDRD